MTAWLCGDCEASFAVIEATAECCPACESAASLQKVWPTDGDMEGWR